MTTFWWIVLVVATFVVGFLAGHHFGFYYGRWLSAQERIEELERKLQS